jgi:hypothetical protein
MWYQSTFLGRQCGQIFFIFADFFFREEKKEGRDIPEIFGIFCEKLQKQVVDQISSQKNTQVEKKKNRLK